MKTAAMEKIIDQPMKKKNQDYKIFLDQRRH